MKNHTKNSLALLCAVSIFVCVGCSAQAYKQISWTHPSGNDWDIDSAICLQHSGTLTAADQAEIKRIEASAKSDKQSAQVMADTYQIGETMQSLQGVPVDEDLGLAMDVVTGALSFVASAEEQTATEVVKKNKFAACMRNRGWSEI